MIADFGDGTADELYLLDAGGGRAEGRGTGDARAAEVIIPFNTPPDQATALVIDSGFTPDGSLPIARSSGPCDQYTEQAEAFALAVLGEKPLPYGVEDAIKNMKFLDAIFESERTGGWVTL